MVSRISISDEVGEVNNSAHFDCRLTAPVISDVMSRVTFLMIVPCKIDHVTFRSSFLKLFSIFRLEIPRK